MINETMYGLGSKSSVIRELFAYGLERKKVVGEDKVCLLYTSQSTGTYQW